MAAPTTPTAIDNIAVSRHHGKRNQHLLVHARRLLIVLNLRRRPVEHFQSHQENHKPAGRLKCRYRDSKCCEDFP
jgi:hypothetical protein